MHGDGAMPNSATVGVGQGGGIAGGVPAGDRGRALFAVALPVFKPRMQSRGRIKHPANGGSGHGSMQNMDVATLVPKSSGKFSAAATTFSPTTPGTVVASLPRHGSIEIGLSALIVVRRGIQ